MFVGGFHEIPRSKHCPFRDYSRLVGCSEAAGEAEVSLEAVIDSVSRSTRSSDTEVSRNITPSTYKIALTYFALNPQGWSSDSHHDEGCSRGIRLPGRFTTPLLLGRKRIRLVIYGL
jgi:hypothetical protein